MIPPIAALCAPDTLAGTVGKSLDHRRGDRDQARAVENRLHPVGVGPGLIANNLETGDALLERLVVKVGDACLDGVVEALEAQFRFGRRMAREDFEKVMRAANDNKAPNIGATEGGADEE